MIKVEKLQGSATFTRNGKSQPLRVAMVLTPDELKTVKPDAGSVVVYSVDEAELHTLNGAAPAPAAPAAPKSFVPPPSRSKPAVVAPASE